MTNILKLKNKNGKTDLELSNFDKHLRRGTEKEHGDFTFLPKTFTPSLPKFSLQKEFPLSPPAQFQRPGQPKEKKVNTSPLKWDQKEQSAPSEDFASKPHFPYLSPLHLEIQSPNWGRKTVWCLISCTFEVQLFLRSTGPNYGILHPLESNTGIDNTPSTQPTNYAASN